VITRDAVSVRGIQCCYGHNVAIASGLSQRPVSLACPGATKRRVGATRPAHLITRSGAGMTNARQPAHCSARPREFVAS
jgi:hypothetical protein